MKAALTIKKAANNAALIIKKSRDERGFKVIPGQYGGHQTTARQRRCVDKTRVRRDGSQKSSEFPKFGEVFKMDSLSIRLGRILKKSETFSIRIRVKNKKIERSIGFSPLGDRFSLLRSRHFFVKFLNFETAGGFIFLAELNPVARRIPRGAHPKKCISCKTVLHRAGFFWRKSIPMGILRSVAANEEKNYLVDSVTASAHYSPSCAIRAKYRNPSLSSTKLPNKMLK